jgi:ankyrin repeat protein
MATYLFRDAWNCAQRGDTAALRPLLSRASSPAALRLYIRVASANGHTDVVKLLLQTMAPTTDADRDETLLLFAVHFATRFGHADTLRGVLAAGHASTRGNLHSVSGQGEDCLVPVQIAAQHGHVGALCELLHARAAVNDVGTIDKRSPMQLATDHCNAGVLRVLLAAKANFNVPRQNRILHAGYGGCTIDVVKFSILDKAAASDDKAILDAFAEAGILLPPPWTLRAKIAVWNLQRLKSFESFAYSRLSMRFI